VIGRAEALELARAEVEREGLEWVEPVRVNFGVLELCRLDQE
jgi:hypothetical protein